MENKESLQVVEISPETAEMILQKNYEGNRAISEKVVDLYAELMERGLWNEYVGGSIKMSENGELLDGQHRLHAVIKYGKPVKFIFVEGIESENFSLIDTSNPRKANQFLTKYGNASAFASFLRIKINYERYGLVNKIFYLKVHNYDISNEASERNYQFVADAKSITRTLGCGSIGALAFLLYLADKVNSKKEKEFVEELKNKLSIYSLAVSNKLLGDKNKGISITAERSFKIYERIWKSFCVGQLVTKFYTDTENVKMFGLTSNR